jgi:hypothetical protein
MMLFLAVEKPTYNIKKVVEVDGYSAMIGKEKKW